MKRSAQMNGRRAMMLAAAMLGLTAAARAQYLPIYGGLSYSPASGNGYDSPAFGIAVNENGVAVSNAFKFVGHASQGFRAVRWDSTGSAVELGNFGTNASGYTASS